MSGDDREAEGSEEAASRQALRDLAEPPDGAMPAPRAQTTLQALPFNELSWPNFEKLVYRLAQLDGAPPEYVSLYGVPGDEQEGIDIYSRLRSGSGYVVYQCKKYDELFPYVVRDAVDEFLDHKWSRPGKRFAGRFVFCTSFPLAKQSLVEEIAKRTGSATTIRRSSSSRGDRSGSQAI